MSEALEAGSLLETTSISMGDAGTAEVPSRIYLVGFMGSGKSTVAKSLASALGFDCIDLDDRITARTGRSIPELFEQMGEAHFRQLETAELARTEEISRAVIACGGGAVLADENRALLNKLGYVIYLEVSVAEAIARIGDDFASRPLLAGGSAELAATSLLKARDSIYRAVADMCIDTADKDIPQISDEIESRIATWR